MIGKTCAAILLMLPSPALAQTNHSQTDHSQMGHGASPAPDADHSGHHPTQAENADARHGVAGGDGIPRGVAPPPPADHAADALYDPAVMARARAAMVRENGGMILSQWMVDRLEYRAGKGRDGYHWEGEGWIGGDIDRLAIKTEGEGKTGGRLENAELWGLYSRAIDPWFNLQAGVRHDFRPGPERTYAAIGIEGLAPYWFEVEAHLLLSDKGDMHFRVEGSYDQRITQRLILQPAAELNFAAQDVAELGIGSGLSDVELGLRLRYEFAREFAPYVGVNWERRFGAGARYARADGERPSATSVVMGARFWF